ncbi:alpha/beta fold hydrolase [Treponema sp.]|uniref:alpha/beta hydrolase n=1 Tax=Treponema sp. TaxID=166 RepID=UPI0025ED9164|nr:alpha/beta fold hydrolase [Treponema sp.]MCR5218479.1 alpha/beta hydrolase [Treponema sp.]
MKKISKILIPVSIIFLFIILTLFLGANFMANKAVAPILPNESRDSDYYTGQLTEECDSDDPVEIFANDSFNSSYQWLRENSTLASIQSTDGLQLNAYLAKTSTDSHKYAIVIHGWKSEPKNVSPYAQHFFEKDFNVLVPGLRGHGWSDGNFVDMGYYCKYDIKSWCRYLIDQDPHAKILLWGVSMGGATVMLTTGLKLPVNVLCAIEDCGYTTAWDQINYRLQVEYNLPAFPLMYAANYIIEKKYDYNLKKTDCLAAVKKSITPTLFIHGMEDDYVPSDHLYKCFNAAKCEKEMLKIEGAKHARSAFKDPETYWNTVDAFADKYFIPAMSD